jgi:hypothetical protein
VDELLALVLSMKGQGSADAWDKLAAAGKALREAFKAKGKPVPLAVICKEKKEEKVGAKVEVKEVKKAKKEGGGKKKGEAATTKVVGLEVTMPSVKAAASAAAERRGGGKGGKGAKDKEKEDKEKDAMLLKLEGMVDKMTKEIGRLETKIAKSAIVKSPSPKKKPKSPAPGSPGKGGKGAGDQELMSEISDAVAKRLKEIWSAGFVLPSSTTSITSTCFVLCLVT